MRNRAVRTEFSHTSMFHRCAQRDACAQVYYQATGQRHYYFMNVGNGEVIDACRKVTVCCDPLVCSCGSVMSAVRATVQELRSNAT